MCRKIYIIIYTYIQSYIIINKQTKNYIVSYFIKKHKTSVWNTYEEERNSVAEVVCIENVCLKCVLLYSTFI